MNEPALENLAETTERLRLDILTYYAEIRALNNAGYGYKRLENATHIPRPTLQRIVAGENPRLNPEL
ncbi:hypothetical protein AN911_00315 [Mycobacteroides immunogenum]|uniref:Uncharacterized protein n=1 Tax=Mycobacteroides immunogenum TaxID=83262 RepID=A0A7V8RXL5_9MYCO|nr:hypothetical protein AN909_05620 [Mycobacteroides immunogenum]KPG14279.1 hypothetical protein AN908_06785 [Mycobacteroides immunogenum]KPG17446.1 hypothetical protein AN910_04845 [Mycobacteroides immunogenum]KPG23970.1 hypothetical protein AN911_00315 [Mycobacteroides immunogenum]KPG39011.1 hypothetical protein AN914_09870 [Mycobacteroides immunogenum]